MSDAEYYRRYREANRERINADHRRWYARNKDKAYANSRKHILRLYANIRKRYGSVCVKCGFSDVRALQIDHIKGGGTRHRKTFKNDYNYYRYVRDAPDGVFQMLCANCNAIKRYENGELNQFPRKDVDGGAAK